MIPDKIFHYTNFEGLKGIVENKALWASDVRYLNDYMEVENGKQWVRHLIDIFGDEFPEFDGADQVISSLTQFVEDETTCFATCFCSNSDQLSQWRGYGEGKPGIAIGFDSKQLSSATNLRLLAVNYDEDVSIQSIEQIVRKAVGRTKEDKSRLQSILADLAEELFFIIVASKNASFREEAELRLVAPVEKAKDWPVKYRIRGPLFVPYMSIQLQSVWPQVVREIWIGPTGYGNETWKSVREFIDYHDLRHVELLRSSSPYRT